MMPDVKDMMGNEITTEKVIYKQLQDADFPTVLFTTSSDINEWMEDEMKEMPLMMVVLGGCKWRVGKHHCRFGKG